MRAAVVSTVLGLLTTVAACTDSEGSSPGTFAVVNDEAWSLKSAVDPPPDDPNASMDRPPMEWYSEHVRTVPVEGGAEGQMVLLSGYEASISDTRATLEAVGWEFDELALNRWDGVGGITPADPTGPAVVLLDHGATTFTLLSYELTSEELAAFAGSVEAVDEATWIARGDVPTHD